MVALLQALISGISSLSPITTVNPDERAVHVRCGRVHRKVGPGLYWKWPIIDQVHAKSVVDTIAELNTQSLMTRDLKAVSLSSRIKYRISDVAKAHFEVYDVEDAIVEEAEASVASAVMDRDLDKCYYGDIESEVFEHIEETLRNWGIEVVSFSVTNFAICRTIRLLQE